MHLLSEIAGRLLRLPAPTPRDLVVDEAPVDVPAEQLDDGRGVALGPGALLRVPHPGRGLVEAPIVELLERGLASQLLLSQDVCHDRQLKANGGFGYAYLQQHFLPTLRTAAVGEGEIRTMTIENPARILTIP